MHRDSALFKSSAAFFFGGGHHEFRAPRTHSQEDSTCETTFQPASCIEPPACATYWYIWSPIRTPMSEGLFLPQPKRFTDALLSRISDYRRGGLLGYHRRRNSQKASRRRIMPRTQSTCRHDCNSHRMGIAGRQLGTVNLRLGNSLGRPDSAHLFSASRLTEN
jgi:hypothetical protein